jgi:hypothetical protein
VTQEALNVLNGGQLPEGWNETTIVLIPKVKNPDKLKDLRPICLCNVVYKIVSKVLDDRIEWHFLAKMMEKMGFHERWIDRVMTCVTSVTYRIKVNGVLTDPFAPGRGLRRDDPLSPYLFLLCAEGFSALLQKAEEDGRIKGVKVCPRAPSVPHLLFVDDSLLLLRTSVTYQ